MVEAPVVEAAGAVVVRKGREVLLVHRPRYDDWSFPKGKLDPGEHVTSAAVREVAEETGLDVRLGPPLPVQRYDVSNGGTRSKVVHYWVARAVHGDDVSGYRRNEEIDEVAWFAWDKAHEVLSYARDRDILEAAEPVRKKTHPLVVLRHAKARPRKSWSGDDRKRPLDENGRAQAEHLVPVLAAYGVRRVLSSSSNRCWTTVGAFADMADIDLEVTSDLSEEDAKPRTVKRHVDRLLDRAEPSVVCTHRPVLPLLYDALGVADPKLRPGGMLVVHHRRGNLVAVEQHSV